MWRSGGYKQLIFLVFAAVIIYKASSECTNVNNCVDCYYSSGWKCLKCKDGYYRNSQYKCYLCRCNCAMCVSSHNCTKCKTGFYGSFCSEQCDINCFQAVCNQHNGTCVHGCRNGYYLSNSSCLKCSLPNCDECSEPHRCTRCGTGYNLWSSGGITYCNVGCPPGTWGYHCQNNCSSNCSGIACEKTNGHCDSCSKYRYGDTCQFRCSAGCHNGTDFNVCDRETGQCMHRCKAGHFGKYCETVVDGQWGRWSDFGPCSVTCGEGLMSRTRSCDKLMLQHGGQHCTGDGVEMTKCTIASCPDTRCREAKSDFGMGETTGVVFGVVLSFGLGVIIGCCTKKRNCHTSENQSNTYLLPRVAYLDFGGRV